MILHPFISVNELVIFLIKGMIVLIWLESVVFPIIGIKVTVITPWMQLTMIISMVSLEVVWTSMSMKVWNSVFLIDNMGVSMAIVMVIWMSIMVLPWLCVMSPLLSMVSIKESVFIVMSSWNPVSVVMVLSVSVVRLNLMWIMMIWMYWWCPVFMVIIMAIMVVIVAIVSVMVWVVVWVMSIVSIVVWVVVRIMSVMSIMVWVVVRVMAIMSIMVVIVWIIMTIMVIIVVIVVVTLMVITMVIMRIFLWMEIMLPKSMSVIINCCSHMVVVIIFRSNISIVLIINMYHSSVIRWLKWNISMNIV